MARSCSPREDSKKRHFFEKKAIRLERSDLIFRFFKQNYDRFLLKFAKRNEQKSLPYDQNAFFLF